jgi:hypothetical protein|tara:strand:+ start:187 stop:582 length:396 start_codon:yes stop_codon:yes gene_type:complete
MIKTISLSLVAISLLLVSIVAIAEPPNFDQNYYYPPPSQNAPPAQQSPVDNVISILLDQGFAGAIIVCLGLWTFRESKLNRATQKENFDKFVAISSECSGHMASVSARLENIEREIESTKQLELLQATRKG